MVYTLHVKDVPRSAYPVKVDLWKMTRGSRVAILPNLNCKDEVWRRLFRDVRVRRALSLAIDRHEINMAVFYGLGTASADTDAARKPPVQTRICRCLDQP